MSFSIVGQLRGNLRRTSETKAEKKTSSSEVGVEMSLLYRLKLDVGDPAYITRPKTADKTLYTTFLLCMSLVDSGLRQ